MLFFHARREDESVVESLNMFLDLLHSYKVSDLPNSSLIFSFMLITTVYMDIYMANLASCVAHVWAVFMCYTRVSKTRVTHVWANTCYTRVSTHVWAHTCYTRVVHVLHTCEILTRVKHVWAHTCYTRVRPHTCYTRVSTHVLHTCEASHVLHMCDTRVLHVCAHTCYTRVPFFC